MLRLAKYRAAAHHTSDNRHADFKFCTTRHLKLPIQHANGRKSRQKGSEQCKRRLADQRRGLVALLHLVAFSNPTYAASAVDPSQYVPEPYNPGWEVWIGAIAAAIPFVIGSWEFGKRILIQRRCKRCQGSGLIKKRRYRNNLDVRKCPDCGGFFPWQGWGRFLTSTAAPGNGGPLQQPKGQSSVFYRVPAVDANDEGERHEEDVQKEGNRH